MAPVIRISDETYARMQKHAKPFEDTPESIIAKALAALEMMDGELPSPAQAPAAKRGETPKLPQKEFRVPLLMALMKFGGKAQAKDVRSLLGPIMAPKLTDGDYESVSTGDPRWWNAACWERSDLVKDGLMRGDSERGVWEISEGGKTLPAALHRIEHDGTDTVIGSGTLQEIAEGFWRRQSGPRPFVKVGDVTFNPILLRRVAELPLSVRSDTCLSNDGIVYIGELVQRTQDELLRTPNFGRKSVIEVNEELARLGLKMGMTVPGGPIKMVDDGAGTMVWGKRRFKDVEYVPYFERFEKLLIANGAQYREFIMVSTKTDDPFVDDFYIGVPNEAFLMLFDGFEKIGEEALPAEINTLHIADATTREFKSRFTFAKDLR